MKRTESSALYRLDKDANAPRWMTPQYSTAEGIVRNRALVVSAMSGAVFQDCPLPTVAIDEKGHICAA